MVLWVLVLVCLKSYLVTKALLVSPLYATLTRALSTNYLPAILSQPNSD